MFEGDRGTAGNRWPVVRLGSGGRTEVTLLSCEFFALTTHWQRCTVPCAGGGCALCELLPARGLFYLAVVCGGRVSLLELGAMSAGSLEQHAKLLHQGMRQGLVFSLTRRGAKSPVHSECIRESNGVSAVTAIDLARHVLALYKFPPPNPEEDLGRYEVRIRSIALRRNEHAAAVLLAQQKRCV